MPETTHINTNGDADVSASGPTTKSNSPRAKGRKRKMPAKLVAAHCITYMSDKGRVDAQPGDELKPADKSELARWWASGSACAPEDFEG